MHGHRNQQTYINETENLCKSMDIKYVRMKINGNLLKSIEISYGFPLITVGFRRFSMNVYSVSLISMIFWFFLRFASVLDRLSSICHRFSVVSYSFSFMFVVPMNGNAFLLISMNFKVTDFHEFSLSSRFVVIVGNLLLIFYADPCFFHRFSTNFYWRSSMCHRCSVSHRFLLILHDFLWICLFSLIFRDFPWFSVDFL